MSNLEHFVAGAGEHVHMLGRTAPMNPNSEMLKVYSAEAPGQEGGWVAKDPTASKMLTLKQAREFTGKVLNHPSMDSIPGIDEVRKNYDPKTDIVATNKLWWTTEEGRPQSTGGMVTDEKSWEGKPNRLLINRADYKANKKKIQLGGLTHEIAHMIVNDVSYPNAGHNWAHARVHLHIVKNMLGNNSYKLLKKHYDAHEVDYGD